MGKKELENKLEQARTDKQLAMQAANEEIARIEAQLTEPAKPVLKHGDYGYWSGRSRIFLEDRNNKLRPFGTGLDGTGKCFEKTDYVILGNIFADLAEIKPIDGFEMEHATISVSVFDGILKIEDPRDDEAVYVRDIRNFILKLRGVYLKMKQGK